MSDYCTCCASNTEHIRQHYDPDGLTRPDEDPEYLLALYRDCDPECGLNLADVKAYIAELQREAEEEDRKIKQYLVEPESST